MQQKFARIHVGLRTIKTCVAVIIAMLIVDSHGASSSKLVFAMLGAMAAVQPTFQESLESCLGQLVCVLIGSIFGVLMRNLPIPGFIACGFGILLVITVYNSLLPRYIPNLACFVVVLLCTTPDIQPVSYALARMWDTAIGLSVGFMINTLVLPYNNSSKIVATIQSLERELIQFLEHMFDGQTEIPDADLMVKKIDAMDRQLEIFAKQKLVLHLRRQQQELETFRLCEGKARELVAQMEVLCRMGRPGRLNDDNRRRLAAAGAQIRDQRPLDAVQELDVVTNYHVAQILTLRRELMQVLQNTKRGGRKRQA